MKITIIICAFLLAACEAAPITPTPTITPTQPAPTSTNTPIPPTKTAIPPTHTLTVAPTFTPTLTPTVVPTLIPVECDAVVSGDSIQDVVNYADVGDVICLRGTYNENVTIAKDGVTLQSYPGESATISGISRAITVKADNVTIEGLIILHPAGSGVRIDGYNGRIQNAVIQNNYIDTGENPSCVQIDSIYMQYADNPIIENNTVINRGGCATVDGAHVDLFQAYKSENITVRNNYMGFTPDAGNNRSQAFMVEYFGGYFKLSNNVIYASPNGGHGLAFMNDAGGELFLWDNTVVAQSGVYGYALAVNLPSDTIQEMKNNIFIGDGSFYPVRLYGGYPAPGVIDYNTIDDGGYPYVAYVDGVGRLDFAAWQALGYDAHGQNIPVEIPPLEYK